jgi:hypothetical protein
MRNWHQLLMHGRRHYPGGAAVGNDPHARLYGIGSRPHSVHHELSGSTSRMTRFSWRLKSGSDEDVMALYVDLAEVLLIGRPARLAEAHPDGCCSA